MSFLVKDGKILTLNGKTIAVNTSASVTAPGGWIGTTVPNSGYVEKVYFNTNLSVEEVVSILETIDYNNIGVLANVVLYNGLEENMQLLSITGKNEENPYVISLNDEILIFTSEDMGLGFVGWNPEISFITIASNVVNEYDGLSVGSNNDKLSSLISITPFVQTQAETIQLSGEYDGTTLYVNELPKGKNVGTPVPNDEYVEKIYINPNITIDELRESLKKLDWEKQKNGFDYSHAIFEGDNVIVGLVIGGNENGHENLDTIKGFVIAGVKNSEPIVFGDFPRDWQPNAETPMPSVLNINDFPSSEYGHKNHLLSSLFSITPFSEEEKNTINIKSLLEQQKLPLNIKVNIPSGAIENVEEFPTSNVYDNVIYKVDKMTKPQVFLHAISYGVSLNLGDNMTIIEVDELPNDMRSVDDGFMYVCGDYAYVKFEKDGVWQVSTIGEYYAGGSGISILDKGAVDSVEEMTEDGFYVIKGKQVTLQGVKGDTYNYIDNEWCNYKELFEKINDKSIDNIDNIDFGMRVGDFLFRNCKNLKEINSGKIKWVGSCAFSLCYNLTTVNLPNCTIIDAGAFEECHSLTSVNAPNCKSIYAGAFRYCSELKTIDFPLITKLGDWDGGGDSTFECCGLTEVYLPQCNRLKYRTFAICQSLTTVKLPVCHDLGEETFDDCYRLTDLYLGVTCNVYETTFKGLEGITTVTVHVRESDVNFFQNNYNWQPLIASGVVTIVGDYTD